MQRTFSGGGADFLGGHGYGFELRHSGRRRFALRCSSGGLCRLCRGCCARRHAQRGHKRREVRHELGQATNRQRYNRECSGQRNHRGGRQCHHHDHIFNRARKRVKIRGQLLNKRQDFRFRESHQVGDDGQDRLTDLDHDRFPCVRELLPLTAKSLIGNLLCGAGESHECRLQDLHVSARVHRFPHRADSGGRGVDARVHLIHGRGDRSQREPERRKLTRGQGRTVDKLVKAVGRLVNAGAHDRRAIRDIAQQCRNVGARRQDGGHPLRGGEQGRHRQAVLHAELLETLDGLLGARGATSQVREGNTGSGDGVGGREGLRSELAHALSDDQRLANGHHLLGHCRERAASLLG